MTRPIENQIEREDQIVTHDLDLGALYTGAALFSASGVTPR
jgi:hypothetical protein